MTNAAPGAGGIRLVPLAEVRPEAIARELNDFEVSRWLTRVPYPYDIAMAEEFLARARSDMRVRAILAPEGFAGMVGVENGLGYWLGRRFWGRGYGPEAARRMVARHFLSPASVTLGSGYLEGNGRSAKVLMRLGFRAAGDEMVVPASVGREVLLHKVNLDRAAFWASLGLPIRTERLNLRPMAPEDCGDLLKVVTRPEAARMLFIFHPGWTEAQALPFIDDWAYDGRDRHLRLAIEKDGHFVGSIGVGDGAVPPIFYFLSPEVAGQGVATEAVSGFTRFLFDRFGLEAVTADVFSDNPASSRVLSKCGFVEAGHGTGTSAARLEPAPIVHYRLEAKERGLPMVATGGS
jgi:RimJ/RimL family protein N-acetyltransferase